MPVRLLVAYALIALMVMIALALIVVVRRRRSEQRRIMRGHRPRSRQPS